MAKAGSSAESEEVVPAVSTGAELPSLMIYLRVMVTALGKEGVVLASGTTLAKQDQAHLVVVLTILA
jgi:hypothetical protein